MVTLHSVGGNAAGYIHPKRGDKMRYSMVGRLMSGLHEVRGRISRFPVPRLRGVSPFAVLPLFVSGLLAMSPAAGAAQCWNCGWSPFGEFPSTICEGGGSGSEDCAQIGRSHDHHCETSGGDCEDDLFAMNSTSDSEAVGTVMAGQMLAASTGYYFVVDGESTVIRRKCGNSLVARISNIGQPLVLAARVGLEQGEDGLGVWRSETDLETDIGQ